MKIQTVLILAGGDGDRFYPLQQKMRFRFNGKSLLKHIVESVEKLAEEVVIVTNETNKTLIQADLVGHSVLFVTQTKSEGGMADAVLSAEKLLTRDVLILNSNDMFDFSVISQLIEQTKKENAPFGFIAKHVDTYFPGGYVIFENEKAVGLVEKPAPDKVPSPYVKLVADYFPVVKLFLDELKKHAPADDQNEHAMTVLMKKTPATCLRYLGDWATLKFSWHVLSMQDYFFAHASKPSIDSSPTVHKTATIEGAVFLGKNVHIGAYSKITGPCFIGDNVVIGDHSLVRSSTIENNSLVGSGCEVTRSYLAEGVMLHRNYVGDSVLSENVTMGAGAVTANYRFDGKTVKTPIKDRMVDTQKGKLGLIAGIETRIGVNSCTYPGVKCAPGTVILPGEVVTKDR